MEDKIDRAGGVLNIYCLSDLDFLKVGFIPRVLVCGEVFGFYLLQVVECS